LDNPWPDAPNMQRLTVDRGADEDPPQITVTMDLNNPFEIIRSPWQNNPPLFNRAPCVDAGSAQTISQLDTLVLDGAATDDGVPTNPGSLTITWSKVSGPGDVLFGDANALTTTANFTSGGIYELRLTAYDGELASSADVTITVIIPCEGDFGGDGDVDDADLAVFAADFGRTDCSGDCEGDFIGDGDVDGSDFDVFAADFGRTDCP